MHEYIQPWVNIHGWIFYLLVIHFFSFRLSIAAREAQDEALSVL
jgi:hypothetical protein